MEKIISGDSYNGTLQKADLDEMRVQAERHYANFLKSLGYDIERDVNMKDTPRRVVKLFMNEICKGTYQKSPKIAKFDNARKYDGIVFSGNIDLKSICSHHMCFISGSAYVAYVPKDHVIGLSKLNRIVDWFARRPQLQENLTMQIHDYLNEILRGNYGIAVAIDGFHSCVSMRGVEQKSKMMTSKLSGCFLDQNNKSREEFYSMVKCCNE